MGNRTSTDFNTVNFYPKEFIDYSKFIAEDGKCHIEWENIYLLG